MLTAEEEEENHRKMDEWHQEQYEQTDLTEEDKQDRNLWKNKILLENNYFRLKEKLKYCRKKSK